MTKFRIGSRVRIVQSHHPANGTLGTIFAVSGSEAYPWRVQFDTDVWLDQGANPKARGWQNDMFEEYQLELINGIDRVLDEI